MDSPSDVFDLVDSDSTEARRPREKEKTMTHIDPISKPIPAKAFLGHPSLVDSVTSFVKDPFGTLFLHVSWIFIKE
jgi:hypothetical protein